MFLHFVTESQIKPLKYRRREEDNHEVHGDKVRTRNRDVF